MQNTITIEVPQLAEIAAKLDTIIAKLEGKTAQNQPEKVKAEEVPAMIENEPEKTEEPAEAPAPSVTPQDIQRKVVELSAAGKKAEVRAIIMAYAQRVSAIPTDKIMEVWNKLNALEG